MVLPKTFMKADVGVIPMGDCSDAILFFTGGARIAILPAVYDGEGNGAPVWLNTDRLFLLSSFGGRRQASLTKGAGPRHFR